METQLDSYLMLTLYVTFTFQMFLDNATCLQRSVNKVWLQIIPQVSVLTTRGQVLKLFHTSPISALFSLCEQLIAAQRLVSGDRQELCPVAF